MHVNKLTYAAVTLCRLVVATSSQPLATSTVDYRRHIVICAALRSRAGKPQPDREAHSIAAPERRQRPGVPAGSFRGVDPAVADAVLHLGAVHAVHAVPGGSSRVPVGASAISLGDPLSTR